MPLCCRKRQPLFRSLHKGLVDWTDALDEIVEARDDGWVSLTLSQDLCQLVHTVADQPVDRTE